MNRKMADEQTKTTVSELANALQTVALLSARLRRELNASAQEAVDLEAATWSATMACRRLQPSGGV